MNELSQMVKLAKELGYALFDAGEQDLFLVVDMDMDYPVLKGTADQIYHFLMREWRAVKEQVMEVSMQDVVNELLGVGVGLMFSAN